MIESESAVGQRERIGFLTIALCIVLPIAFFLIFLTWGMRSVVAIDDAVKLRISRGDGFLEIGDMLAVRGIVRSPALFRLYALARGWAGSLKPGEYVFYGDLSVPDVARMLNEGPGDAVITFPEGFTIFDIEERLVKAELTAPGEFLQLAHSPDLFAEKFPFLRDLEAETLEGFLFPDTYRFGHNLGARAIVEKMLATFRNKALRDLEAKFQASPQSISAIITMASMLEREAARMDERRLISGILWKRLETGMPLQVDATVIYAWQKLNPRWSLGGRNRLSFADLKIDSPYNTYRVNGMPPGPIANPGLDSIQAALEPVESDYWFYLSPPDGTVLFTRTFEEHVALKGRVFD